VNILPGYAAGQDQPSSIAIDFTGTVTPVRTKLLLAELTKAVNSNIRDITILLSTKGGSTESAVEVHNFILGLGEKADIRMHALGDVLSAGVIIFSAGTRRTAAPEAMFGLHPSKLKIPGPVNEGELEHELNQFRLRNRNVRMMIARATGIPEKEIFTWETDQRVFSVEEAKQRGLVHQISHVFHREGMHIVTIPEP
jgi:ATP-dependent protease ClpP protease subunit